MTKLAAVILLVAIPLAAQEPAKKDPPPSPPVASLNFSGVLFANFQYRAETTARAANKFDVERAYLTFRMPAGDRASVRVTGDLFQQTDSANSGFYKGWVLRAKFAYFQYDFLKSNNWTAVARAGLVQTIAIEHLESFWPRWISPTAVDRAGFFSAADAGVASLVTLPNKTGEAYFTITNGPGYTSRETDRFKDYSARVSLTPFANRTGSMAETATITGWVYRGAVASKFVNGGTGQIGAVGSGLARDHAGIFAGLKDPRLAIGTEIDVRNDDAESGANSPASPRITTDSSGRLLSAFALIKPFLFRDPKNGAPLGLIGRIDRLTPNTGSDATIRTLIAGLIWDLNKRSSVSLDYQTQTPHSGANAASTKTWFAHLVANF